MLLAACVTTPVGRPVVTQGPVRAASTQPIEAPAPAAKTTPACTDCGTVAHIETIAAGKSSNALGGIVGGVAGKPMAGQLAYKIHVRMDDGRSVVIQRDDADGMRQGQRVRVVGGKLVTP
ncbi:MAG: hypothetical protein QM769_10165 [Pseudoxanthomonas sp.]